MPMKELQLLFSENTIENLLVQTSKIRRFFWHIATPKSGSTWLSLVLVSLLKGKGWAWGNLLPHHGERAQEIDPRYFFLPGDGNIFFRHQHCVYSEYTEHLLKVSGTTSFLQVRNIFDIITSLVDHKRKVIKGEWYGIKYLPSGCESWTDSLICDYVIDIDLPWLVKFLNGWLTSSLVLNNDIYVLRYEDLVDTPIKSIRDLFTFAKIEGITDSEIENALTSSSKGKTLFNKGVYGRGKKLLSSMQIEKIEKYLNYYPKTDFSIVK